MVLKWRQDTVYLPLHQGGDYDSNVLHDKM